MDEHLWMLGEGDKAAVDHLAVALLCAWDSQGAKSGRR